MTTPKNVAHTVEQDPLLELPACDWDSWQGWSEPAKELCDTLLVSDPVAELNAYVLSGRALEVLPELPALELVQDPVHKHKDILAHTIIVTSQTPPRLRVRLAALFHDIGKPRTRKFEDGEVTFRHHEVVGAKIARRRMIEMGFPARAAAEVNRIVELSGRFKGFDQGWTDSAVRRYARDAGDLLGDLNDLVRADCTSRHLWKREAIAVEVARLEERITALARDDAHDALRPSLDGNEIMEILGVAGGREVGAAWRFLRDLNESEGPLDKASAQERLLAWWNEAPPPEELNS